MFSGSSSLACSFLAFEICMACKVVDSVSIFGFPLFEGVFWEYVEDSGYFVPHSVVLLYHPVNSAELFAPLRSPRL